MISANIRVCDPAAGVVTQQIVIEEMLNLLGQLNSFESFSTFTGKYFRHSFNQFLVCHFLPKHNIDKNTCENGCAD